MILFLLFYILIIPICILLHEVGHGMGVIFTSNYHAHIYLGKRNEDNRENFKIGRLHFHVYWSYVGFVYWEAELTRRQRAFALIGGPLMSLMLVLLFGCVAILVPQNDIRSLFWSVTVFNFIQFVVTIIPINYPSWMGAYKGYPSDGLQLLQIIRNK